MNDINVNDIFEAHLINDNLVIVFIESFLTNNLVDKIRSQLVEIIDSSKFNNLVFDCTNVNLFCSRMVCLTLQLRFSLAKRKLYLVSLPPFLKNKFEDIVSADNVRFIAEMNEIENAPAAI